MLNGFNNNKRKNEMLKEPKDYAEEIKKLGYTKMEFFDHLLNHKMPREYIFDCLEAW